RAMYRRGPMPMPLRLAVLALFATVALITIVPMVTGTVLFGVQTAEVIDEYAPTDDDKRMARDLAARADAAGVELEVTAFDIAHARRTGQLDQIDAMATEVLGVGTAPYPGAAPAHGVAPETFRTEEPEPAGISPGLGALYAFGGVFLFVAACGAAVMAVRSMTNASR
ncbi:MAG: hypothetical protein AAF602_29040, partial [Myxococcota bacterium]